MAGVPAVFEAMVAGLLPRLTGGRPLLSETLRVDRPEGEVAGPLRLVAEAHPAVSIGSYPFIARRPLRHQPRGPQRGAGGARRRRGGDRGRWRGEFPEN